GNVAGIQERAREERGGVWLEQWLQDARYSVRALARAPGFALTVWGTLVVGIGLASAIMGLTAPTLFAPQADGLQLIGYKDKRNPFTPLRPGLHWEAYREQVTSFSALGAVFRENQNVLIQGRPVIATALRASNDCFSTLGIQPVLGRTFLPEEHQRGPNGGVVILSGHFWRQHFNSDPAILGREITIAQRSCTVIGVFAPDAPFPPPFSGDVYLPMAFRADARNPLMPMLHIVGRLRPGVTVVQAEAELAAVKLPEIPPWAANFLADQQTVLQKPWETNRPETQWVVLIAALLLYALAALNAMNLMVLRLLRRRQEFAIRLALGGTRWRVIRLLLLEGLGLAALAG
ncbi:MAG TPA: ABC transporter permease, partial [Steroidobacteraceae bacterium]|nr:ABC transporter permease [Steroidobacteraceae bacterium]